MSLFLHRLIVLGYMPLKLMCVMGQHAQTLFLTERKKGKIQKNTEREIEGEQRKIMYK